MAKKKSILLNPNTFTGEEYDPKTAAAFKKAIDFFEDKGLKEIREDVMGMVWQWDWYRYQKKHGLYSLMLTAAGYGDDDARFDLYRQLPFSELLSFYSQGYQYTFQVSVLGVGPVWMGNNEYQKKELGQMLKDGHMFAFGMSEKEHGADLYSNEATIKPIGDGKYVANGNKYYIGNAQIAPKIPTLGKNTETGEWAFWVVDCNDRHYDYVKDISIPELGNTLLGEYEMIEYPITDRDILKMGDGAFADGLSTINIGKFHCAWAVVGIATHAFYEAITHTNRRRIYDKPVTDFPHIRSFLSDAFCRTNAMRLYVLRATDYFRKMSEDDRRYLLFNPVAKMKVTTQAGEVMRLIMDTVCAKGYENENYISEAFSTAEMPARLEGTAHVNLALVLKFIRNYFLGGADYPEIGIVDEMKDDSNVLRQTAGGLAKVKFPDYKKPYEGVNLGNVKIFFEIVELFKKIMTDAAPDEAAMKNMDYMMGYGDIFAMVVYAQLVLESAQLREIEDDLIDQIFALFIKDVNKFALQQLNNQVNTAAQSDILREIALKGPVVDKEKDFKFWQEYVQSQDGVYVMNDAPIGND